MRTLPRFESRRLRRQWKGLVQLTEDLIWVNPNTGQSREKITVNGVTLLCNIVVDERR